MSLAKNIFIFIIGVALTFYIGTEFRERSANVNDDSVSPSASQSSLDLTTLRLMSMVGESELVLPYNHSYYLVFFGYSHCPDICPLALQNMAAVQKLDDVQDVTVSIENVFISLDYERDSPQRLQSYVGQFSSNFRAFTAETDELKSVLDHFHVQSRKSGSSAKAYGLDHTPWIFLVSPQRKIVNRFPSDISARALLQGVLSHIESVQK